MFGHSNFWSAFERAGMLDDATYHPSAGPAVPGIKVGFLQPDVLLLGEMVQSTEYEIEYQTSDMPSLRSGETIDINAETYEVRGNPSKVGNGYFSKVKLTKQ